MELLDSPTTISTLALNLTEAATTFESTTATASDILLASLTMPTSFSDNFTENDPFFTNQTRFPIPHFTFEENVWAAISCLFYGTAFIFGAIGNGLIIYIVWHYSRMRSLCNVFLASLATADFLLVCVCIPVKLAQLLTYTWTLGAFTCKMLHYVQNVSAFCSVLTLTTMSVERYYAILHPVECRTTFSMHHIQKIIVVIWLLALAMSAPVIYIYIHMPIGDPALLGTRYYYCIKINADHARWMYADEPQLAPIAQWQWWRKAYELYMLTAILIIPALIMTFTYWRICSHLWSIVSRRTAIRYGHTCQVMPNIEPKKTPKVSKTPTKVLVTSSAANGVVVTTANLASTSTTSSSNVSSTASSTSSTAQLHQDCRRSMEEDNHQVKSVIKMLVFVVLLFILCWGPMLLINLLKGFRIVPDFNEDWMKEVVSVCYFLAYLNSVLNPLIYFSKSKNFRHHLNQIFSQLSERICGTRTPPSPFGSTKSDATKGKTPGPPGFIRLDALDKKATTSPTAGATSPKATTVPARKPSEPNTEEVSVNDTWPQVTVQGH